MPGAKKNFIGLEGFIWWIGVVEDRQDPEQLGRVRVRCFGWHSEEKNKIPTDSLPWAHPVIPVNAGSFGTPKEGEMVFGFFVDGESAQQPAIVGIVPGKPLKKPNYQNGFTDPRTNLSSAPKKPDDAAETYPKSKYLREPTINRLSRGKADGTIISTRKKNLKKNVKSAGGVNWSEPSPSFAPQYPYNNAYESESGHALEFDDTPNNERVHLAHRSGAYFEFDKDGSRLERVQKDNYTVIMGDDFIYVKGKATITVDGNFNLKTSTINIEAKAINIAADDDIKIKGKNVSIESTSNMNLKAGGKGNFTSGAKLSLKGSTAALAGSTVDIPAGKIGLQSGSAESASGTGLKGGGTSASSEELAAAAEAANVAAAAVANTAAIANSVAAVTDVTTEISGALSNAFSFGANALSQAASFGSAELSQATSFGKELTNSSTVDSLVGNINKKADDIIKGFNANQSIGELTTKVSNFESTVNDNTGNILNLKTNDKNNILRKVETVSNESSNKNIAFSLDTRLSDEIKSLNKQSNAEIQNVLAKQLYPKTITTSNTTYLGRKI
jgi:hypothetical protein